MLYFNLKLILYCKIQFQTLGVVYLRIIFDDRLLTFKFFFHAIVVKLNLLYVCLVVQMSKVASINRVVHKYLKQNSALIKLSL